MSVGLICDTIPIFRVAERHHRRALAIATETGQPIALGHAMLGMGIHAHSMGALDSASDYYQRSATTFGQIGHIRGWGGATMMRAWTCEDLGDFERAAAHAEAVNAAGAESSDPQVRAWGLQRRGASARQDGRITQAIDDLQLAIELCREIPDYAGVVQGLALLGLCHLDGGDHGLARTSVDQANALRRERQLRGIWVTHAMEAAAAVSLAELDAAATGRRLQLKRARSACGEAMNYGKAAPHFRPTALRLVGTLRWQEGRPAAAEQHWVESANAATAIGSEYQKGLAKAALGQFLGMRGALVEAAALFKKSGARVQLARVEHILHPLGEAGR
jgi:tetratricopeptide (TPR) repeat protein